MFLFDDEAIEGWLGDFAGAAPATPGRVTIAPTEGVAFSSHSFLAFAAGVTPDGGSTVLASLWQGTRHLNYLGFSSLKQRWDANGVDRTGDYSGALWLTEFVNPADGGWPAPDSAAGRETLQYLYWYGLTAQRKGCKAIFLYPPWSPQGMEALDPQTMSWFQRQADWWNARPDATIPAYVMPVPAIVAGFRAMFAPQSIYSDGLHLRGSNDAEPNKHMDALAVGLDMMMTGTRPANDPSWTAEMIAQVDIVWAAIRDYACTGLGGAITVTPTPVSADPLPDPMPLLRYGLGEGQIGIHLTTDGARVDGGGQVTGLINQGAAGALFDATVLGAPLTRNGHTLQLSGSTGTPTLATRASIMGIRLMWVMDCAGLTANMRLFGSDVAGTDDYELRMIVAFNRIYAWTNNGGTSAGQNIHSGNYTYPTSGLHLFEIELSPAGWAVYLNGALIGSAAILAAPFQTDFLLDRIGQGATTAVPLVADMGDILGVRLGAGPRTRSRRPAPSCAAASPGCRNDPRPAHGRGAARPLCLGGRSGRSCRHRRGAVGADRQPGRRRRHLCRIRAGPGPDQPPRAMVGQPARLVGREPGGGAGMGARGRAAADPDGRDRLGSGRRCHGRGGQEG